MWKQFAAALKIVQEQEKRRKQYERLVGAQLDYPIIKDLINQAAHNVVIEMTLKDGTRMVIRRQEDFDSLQKIRSESW